MGVNLRQKIIDKIGYKINFSFEKKAQKRNKNKDFTIFCSSCIGALIYHRLGLRFGTPTINCWMSTPDFFKFIKAPETYLAAELGFVDDKEHNYPVGQLIDIRIYFNHSPNEESAKADWDRRKQRINFDNLYIISYELDEITREDLLSLKDVKCKKLIILTEHKDNCDIPYVKYIKRSKDKNRSNTQSFLDLDRFGMRTFEKEWDFVEWLNS